MYVRNIFGVLLCAACLSAQTSTHSLQVTDVRFWSLNNVTRVAIETSGDFTYKSDHIPNPERLFFDIVGATPKFGGKRITVKNVGDKLLKRIRIAENIPGVTRIVLDLEGPVEYTASQLGNPDRLMVELRPAAGVPVTAPVLITEAPRPKGPVLVPGIVVSTPPPALSSVVSTTPSKVPDVIASPGVEVARSVMAPLKPPPSLPVKKDVPPSTALPALDLGAPSVARKMSGDASRSSLTRALGLKINRVVIDPGHGGHDQGTSGPKGLLEKDLVLDVALRLGKLLEQRLGSEVIYTRSDDTFIPLRERTEIANQKKADLFLSIHANSSPASNVAGIETYYLNFTSSSDSLDVAARENASGQNTVYELSDLVSSIAKHDKIEESKEFATEVQTALQSFETKYIPGAKDRGIRKAPFVVLIGAQMPSILAEIGFISNRQEESLLNKPDHRQKLAEALYKGVSKYVGDLSHFDVTTKRSAGGSNAAKKEEAGSK